MRQAKAVFMMVVYDTPESWLRQAIESVLHQTCPDLYFLIQDNGSTGRTAEILREYAGRDTRIVLFRNEVNNAMTPEENAAWWNLVCRYTLELESEYFAVLDSDDSYAPDFLEVMYQIATEKQADLVVCGTTMVDESGEKNTAGTASACTRAGTPGDVCKPVCAGIRLLSFGMGEAVPRFPSLGVWQWICAGRFPTGS